MKVVEAVQRRVEMLDILRATQQGTAIPKSKLSSSIRKSAILEAAQGTNFAMPKSRSQVSTVSSWVTQHGGQREFQVCLKTFIILV